MNTAEKIIPDLTPSQVFELLEEVKNLAQINHKLAQENAALKRELLALKEHLNWLNKQLFGKRSERHVEPSSGQQLYLPGFEPPPLEDVEKQEVAGHTRTRKKRKPKNDGSNGLLIPDDIPVERTVIDLPEEEKVCPETGQALVKIGEEVARKLAITPSRYLVKEYVRIKYANPQQEEQGVITPPLQEGFLPRSRLDESLLAEIITRKYADHLPLNRLSEIFSREGIQMSRQFLSQNLIRAGKALQPLYDLMLKEIRAGKVLYIDETPVMLQVQGKGKLQQAYMWVLVGANPCLQVYAFRKNRCEQHAFDLMEGFKGTFHSDKYSGYAKLALEAYLLWQPCWAHIRRKFSDVEYGDKALRRKILRKIHHLYMFERVAWARDPEERLRIRQEKEGPLIDSIYTLVEDYLKQNPTLLPKSKWAKAIDYLLSLKAYVKNYLTDPNAHIDNNIAERAMRALAIGRKNWLFVGSEEGGLASAVLLSLVQTCRALNINPREYLEDIMRRFNDHPMIRLHELLPHHWAKERHLKTQAPQMRPLHQR